MPTTINGIGTHYYGKRNLRVYQGLCESCGSHGQLSDYETGYYFVIIFIPVIPLGKKQIVAECARCRVHRVMPLAEWERLRESEIESAMNRLAEAPDEPTHALELLGTLTAFNRPNEARDLAQATGVSHRDNVDVQIGLGAWYESEGETTQAAACFARAVEIDPDYPPCRRIVAIEKIESGKLGEAKTILDDFRAPSEHYDPVLFMMLAQAYQSQSMHAEALQEYENLTQQHPELAKDRSIGKQIKRCKKALKR